MYTSDYETAWNACLNLNFLCESIGCYISNLKIRYPSVLNDKCCLMETINVTSIRWYHTL